VGVWSQNYKTFLESVVCNKEQGFLKEIYDNCTDLIVKFRLECKPNVLTEWTRNLHSTKKSHVDLIEESLKLTSTLSCSNMHMYNAQKQKREGGGASLFFKMCLPSTSRRCK
jgi:hypothetical protein